MKEINFIASSSAGNEHLALWQSCFGDSHEEIKRFLDAAGDALLVECREENELVGMTLLVPVTVRGENAYYGYAVCTAEKHRGKGVCRAIHEEIFRFCDARKMGYFLHPSDTWLVQIYGALGLKHCGGCRYAIFELDSLDSYADEPTMRRATAQDLERDDSDVRWGGRLLEYAAEGDEKRACLCFSDGAIAYVEKNGDVLQIYFSQGLDEKKLSALCRKTACGRIKIRLAGDDMTYLMGYNMPFDDLHVDFVFD